MINLKDLQILSYLRKNARIRVTDIAKNMKLPFTTIYDRIDRINKNAIKKSSVLLDYQKLGYLQTHVTLAIDKKDRMNFIEFMQKHNNINSAYLVNFGDSIIMESVFNNLNEFEDCVKIIENNYNIKKIVINHISHEIKKEEFLIAG
jgi:DNA-binding Lrp family transcriptional regulator